MSFTLRDSLADLGLEADLTKQAQKLASDYGCQNYLLAYINPERNGGPFFIASYSDRAWVSDEVLARDPMAREVHKENPRAQAWDSEIYFRTGNADIWEAANAAGLNSGIVVPIRPGGSRRMLISLSRDAAFDGTDAQLAGQVAELERTTQMLAGVVVSLFDTRIDYESKLSSADKEILKWVFDAVPFADIAHKTNIPLKILNHRVRAIVERLGVASPMQAAMMAARYGAIQ